MISRRTARLLAELYEFRFRHFNETGYRKGYYTLNRDTLYDFLFDHAFESWFCNIAKATYESSGTRQFKEFIMRLHTGESLVLGTKDWSWKQRRQLGQRYLQNLAAALLSGFPAPTQPYEGESLKKAHKSFVDSLCLDGYRFDGTRLLAPETDVLDVQEEAGVLEDLVRALGLQNLETVLHHLRLTEDHFLAGRWDDSIANSRKFLEAVFQEVAAIHCLATTAEPLAETIYTKPSQVRDYLERAGLFGKKEREAIAAVYGLLSETGGHPYMAASEQARLLRHLALTFSQFVLLRLQGQRGGG